MDSKNKKKCGHKCYAINKKEIGNSTNTSRKITHFYYNQVSKELLGKISEKLYK